MFFKGFTKRTALPRLCKDRKKNAGSNESSSLQNKLTLCLERVFLGLAVDTVRVVLVVWRLQKGNRKSGSKRPQAVAVRRSVPGGNSRKYLRERLYSNWLSMQYFRKSRWKAVSFPQGHPAVWYNQHWCTQHKPVVCLELQFWTRAMQSAVKIKLGCLNVPLLSVMPIYAVPDVDSTRSQK